MPPSECPTTAGRSSSICTTTAAMSPRAASHDHGPSPERPCPRKSIVMTRCRGRSCRARVVMVARLPLPPCRSSSGGASPPKSRTAIGSSPASIRRSLITKLSSMSDRRSHRVLVCRADGREAIVRRTDRAHVAGRHHRRIRATATAAEAEHVLDGQPQSRGRFGSSGRARQPAREAGRARRWLDAQVLTTSIRGPRHFAAAYGRRGGGAGEACAAAVDRAASRPARPGTSASGGDSRRARRSASRRQAGLSRPGHRIVRADRRIPGRPRDLL